MKAWWLLQQLTITSCLSFNGELCLVCLSQHDSLGGAIGVQSHHAVARIRNTNLTTFTDHRIDQGPIGRLMC